MRSFKIKCAPRFTKIGNVNNNNAASGTEMPSIDLKYKLENTAYPKIPKPVETIICRKESLTKDGFVKSNPAHKSKAAKINLKLKSKSQKFKTETPLSPQSLMGISTGIGIPIHM